MIDFDKIKVIAFDADDTLWSNEPYYREVEDRYAELLCDTVSLVTSQDSLESRAATKSYISAELFKTEMSNMELLGYGAKAFTISLIENAIKVCRGEVSADLVAKIIALGKGLLEAPMPPLEGVVESLEYLKSLNKYSIIIVTKGDLLDQGNKLKRSGLEKYFDLVEIMPEKGPENYQRLFKLLNISAENFLMIGNSFKSDILPVLNLGGSAIHVPFEVMWQHEVTEEFEHDRLISINSITLLNKLIK